MKHNVKITLIMIFIFFISQILGLFIINEYVKPQKYINETTGIEEIKIDYETIEVANAKIEAPKLNESFSFIYIMIVILVATIIILILARFKKTGIWKLWFSLSVFLATYIALYPYIKKIEIPSVWTKTITIVLVATLVFLKIYKKNPIVHNLTEIIMYGGIAAIFVPVINLFSGAMLLILISIYDFIAVWKSKHMVTLANFQTDSNVFAGLYLLYDKNTNKILKNYPKTKITEKDNNNTSKPKIKDIKEQKTASIKNIIMNKSNTVESSVKQAILGGGDIAFPLIFAGTILKATASIYLAMIVALFSTIALSILLFTSKPNKFYPAMPYISGGCFTGYLIVFLIQLIF